MDVPSWKQRALQVSVGLAVALAIPFLVTGFYRLTSEVAFPGRYLLAWLALPFLILGSAGLILAWRAPRARPAAWGMIAGCCWYAVFLAWLLYELRGLG